MTKIEEHPRRGRPRKIGTDAVLETAMTAYWHGDPADVSVNAICHRADVAKPSLYRAFGSEDGLTLAALDRYAERVLVDVFEILQGGAGLQDTLETLIDFAADDPRMETGCLFYKMRAGRHRLGPMTRGRIEALDRAAHQAYVGFSRSCRDTGDWPVGLGIETGARYLGEQIALAITQRSSGMAREEIRDMLRLALSVFAHS